jgi:hypothetical protein
MPREGCVVAENGEIVLLSTILFECYICLL